MRRVSAYGGNLVSGSGVRAGEEDILQRDGSEPEWRGESIQGAQYKDGAHGWGGWSLSGVRRV